jgi:hypothetical protein
MGIYHNVEKVGDHYTAHHQLPWWNFWDQGDQNFVAHEGDKIYCFIQVFSPTDFKDKIVLHWLQHHPSRGWESMDRIPMHVIGGRRDGFRGFAYKSNYNSGSWRVQVETSDGRELGRLNFRITQTHGPAPAGRVFKQDIF